MALNPELIQFFITRIENANIQSFSSFSSQLFEHLRNEIKDNPIYNEYEKQVSTWRIWIEVEDSFSSHSLPKNFQDVKYLAYTLYRTIADSGDITDLLYQVTGEGDFGNAIYNLNKTFLGYLDQALEDIANANPEIEMGKAEKVKGNRVFIIHGHDEGLKSQVQLLLTRAGVNNIVLHEQPDRGRTIIDKLVEEGKDSNYAIALLTPDDILQDGTHRARQNVILEIGYFMGLLGKERVRLLIKGDIERPSDLEGILYQRIANNADWKMKTLKELQEVGIFVDYNTVMEKL